MTRCLFFSLVAVGLVVLSACDHGGGAQKVATKKTAPVPVQTLTLSAVNEPRSLELTGTLEPGQKSDLTPLVAGRVSKVFVERGAVVKAGQILIKLRDVDFRNSAEAAQAALEQAQARLGIPKGASLDAVKIDQTADVVSARSNWENAEKNAKRAQELKASGVLSQQEAERLLTLATTSKEQYNMARQNAQAALAQLKGAKAQQSQASQALTDSSVTAPFAGEIAQRYVNVGEYVSPQKVVVTLVQTDPLRLEMRIPQEYIRDVKPGQTVEITLDQLSDKPYPGQVRYVSAALDSKTRTLTAEAIIANPNGELRPGLFARAKLVLGGERELAVIPKTATFNVGDTVRAYVVSGDHAEERILHVTRERGGELMVEKGIIAGERLIITHVDTLEDGAKIRATN